MCSIPSGRPTHGCMRSSHTETRGAGKFGSANAPTGTAMCAGKPGEVGYAVSDGALKQALRLDLLASTGGELDHDPAYHALSRHQSRNAPAKASSFPPSRAFAGSSSSFFAFPPPSTT
jgi:hypothetical protein